MDTIKIYSDTMTNESLKAELEAEMNNTQSDIKLELTTGKTKRGEEVKLLVALIAAITANIGILIQSIVKIFLKKKDGEHIIVTIKGKNGREIRFPVGTTKEKIKEYIELAKELETESIIILEDA